MLAVVGSAWALFLGLAFIMLGNGLQHTLLGVRAELEGFPTAVTGLVMTGYSAGFLAGSLVVPRLVGRVGHIRVFAALASLASTAVLVHAVFVEPVIWTAMRVLTGFCYAGLYVVAESWLNDQATNRTRGQLLSIYMVVMLSGVAGGQFLLNLADPLRFGLFILASVLVSLALVPILLTANPAPEFRAPTPVSIAALYRVSPLGVVGMLFTGMGNAALIGMGAVYAKSSGFSVVQISIFMAAATIGGVVLQWPIGRLSDRFDRRRVLTAVAFAAAAAAVAGGVVSDLPAGVAPAWLIFAVIAVFGGMNLPLYSLAIAHTNDFLDPRQMVAASGGLVLVAGTGAIFGSMAVAGGMAFAGPAGYFWTLAVIHGAIGVFALYRMGVRAARPVEDQGPFVAVPRASPVVAALAPEDGPPDPEPPAVATITVDLARQRR